MRPMSEALNTRVIKRMQTKASNAEPKLDFWITRQTTQLLNDALLEKQSIFSGVTDCDIAVRHEHFGRGSDSISIVYVKDGVAKVATSSYYESMKRHTWIDSGFSEPAQKVAIAYDGTMPKDISNKFEFITRGEPWVFWVNNGAVYGRQLGGATSLLAEANATSISATRAMWSDVAGFDFGLVLFMILNGYIYYRQLINGEWYDATMLTAIPTLDVGISWAQVDVSRTWDYRIALQLVDSIGTIYEVFTQFMGIGSKNAEHIIEIKDITSDGELTKVYYKDAKTDEHIEISNITAGALYGGLYSIDIPSAVRAVNIDDGNGDYGKIVLVTFNVQIADVSAEFLQFSLIDDRGRTFVAIAATVDESGKTVILTFNDFNNARGECEIKYTAGTITSMYGTAVPTTSVNFTPTNLVPTEVILPKVVEVYNI